MSAVRQTELPHATVIPKMYILEDHMVPWLRRWHLGAGLMGEQGAESVYSHVREVGGKRFWYRNKVDRLNYIFK